MRAAALLLIAGGCDQLFDLDHLRQPDPEQDVDAATSKLIDAPTECAGTFYGSNGQGGSGLLKLCLQPSGLSQVALAGDIDTTTDTSCDQILTIDDVGTQVCVKLATNMAVSSIRAPGSRGLLLVATGTLTVSGLVDVSSRDNGFRGAGGNWANCQSSAGKSDNSGGSGGAGGSFGTRGGNGGVNSLNQYTGYRPTAPPDRVRGGCEGGNGGDGPVMNPGGNGGKSGGAVYLIAGTVLEFTDTAVVNASGMGGRAGGSAHYASYVSGGGGGGGGGSGGLIGLDAPMISIAPNAIFFANGGGGGGGSSIASSGTDGAEPKSTAIQSAAAGGNGTTYSGKGGAGAAMSSAGSGVGGKAGGGGGGGLGHIVVFTPSGLPTVGHFSPPPITVAQ